mmetsp:Transcript_40963/g.109187  ORF Transcript_40963/g.109187 Transcript_40963/m.109187 type:complete len:204 (-) Transcript_40963:606-1217(-)
MMMMMALLALARRRLSRSRMQRRSRPQLPRKVGEGYLPRAHAVRRPRRGIAQPEKAQLVLREGDAQFVEGPAQVRLHEGGPTRRQCGEGVPEGGEVAGGGLRRQASPVQVQVLGDAGGHRQEAKELMPPMPRQLALAAARAVGEGHGAIAPAPRPRVPVAHHAEATEKRPADGARHARATRRLGVALHADATPGARLRVPQQV